MFVDGDRLVIEQIIEPALFVATEIPNNTVGGVSITDAANDLLIGGDTRARYISTGKIITDAALIVLTRPDIGPHLPSEVYDRAKIATEIVRIIVKHGVNIGLFEESFRQTPIYENEDSSALSLTPFSNVPYLFSVAGSQFSDAGVVAGGALLKLRTEGSTEVPKEREAIMRSTGLLAISGVEKISVPQVLAIMGFPYTLPVYLDVRRSQEGERVTFPDEVKAALEQYYQPGGGCPMGKIKLLGSAHSNTALGHYWNNLIDYLIQPDATVDRPTKKMFVKPIQD